MVFVFALFVLAIDQASKLWISTNLSPGEFLPKDSFFRLTHITNTGTAFGLFPGQSFLFVLIAVAVISIIFFYRRFLPVKSLLVNISLGLQLGGAVGNLVDRFRYGYVIDFVDIRVWPVFNLADSAIVLGVCLLGYHLLFSPEKSVR